MDLIARVKGPTVTREAWLARVAEREDLVGLEPRTAINPFTGQSEELPTPPTMQRVLRDGKVQGQVTFPPTGPAELIVFAEEGSETLMRELADELAAALGGELTPP